ncbi:hypothetical protein WQ57_10015 [Mesobacillus campisalis]|uniref:PAS domain-containing protein n=1 Tax=Mesobacillus campisalis TaxID=1408103 RepID=A0A0M2SYT4_9BACI|nr:PAS domain S-box protein [Mesobacillus campisalis]KKK38142.1 hypothetical protein WQ57_10015 [Mesobacillus campisalis]
MGNYTLVTGKEQFELIWENINEAIFTIARDGSVTHINPAFTNILGWDLKDIGTNKFPFFTDEFNYSEQRELLNKLKKGQSIPYFETKRRRKDGELVDILASYRSVNKGDILAVAMDKDITSEKGLKEQLEVSEFC